MGDIRLALVDPAGGDPQYLTPVGDELEVHPAWSPDGTQLAFVGWASSGGTSNVYVLDLASGVTTQVAGFDVTDDSSYLGRIDGVSWSPDGTKLLFAWGKDIYEVHADGTNLSALPITVPTDPDASPQPPPFETVLPDLIPVAPIWLADGSIAAIVDDQVFPQTEGKRSGERRLATAPAGGGVLTPVSWIPDDIRVESVSWSPDRTRIAYVAAQVGALGSQPGTPDLYVANADGSDSHPIQAAHLKGGDPAWSPDGAHLVFGFGPLRVIDPVTEEVRDLVLPEDRATCWPVWSPTTTTALPAATSTPVPGATPGPVPFYLGALDPGTYRTGTFLPPMEFTLGPGWVGYTSAADAVRLFLADQPSAEIDILNPKIVIEAPGCDDSSTHPLSGEPHRTGDLLSRNTRI